VLWHLPQIEMQAEIGAHVWQWSEATDAPSSGSGSLFKASCRWSCHTLGCLELLRTIVPAVCTSFSNGYHKEELPLRVATDKVRIEHLISASLQS
jgi:hypothetical protein